MTDRRVLERRSYCQGMTQARKDALDGERDALRVLEGLEPLKRPDWPVSPAYREAWEKVAASLTA